MNMKRVANLMLVALVLGTFIAQAKPKVVTEGAALGEWSMDIDAVMALAKEKEVPVLLLFTGSDWCSWCKMLDANLLSEEDWQAFAARNLALGYLDFPKDEEKVPEKYRERNEELSKKYNVEGYPTMVVLDWEGNEVFRPDTDVDEVGKFLVAFHVSLLDNPLFREKLLKQFPEETAQQFHDAFEEIAAKKERRDKLQEELKELSEEINKTSEKQADNLYTEIFDRKFPERAGELKTIGEKFDEMTEELKAWIETDPEENEENKAIFKEKLDQLGEQQDKVIKLLLEII